MHTTTIIMSLRKVLAIFVVLACGYAPVGWAAWVDAGQVSDRLALVYVIQGDTGSFGDAPVYLDGKHIADLPANSYLKIAVVPGPHEISTAGTGRAAMPLNARAGSHYYLKQVVKADGMPQLSVLSDAEGQQLLAQNRALRNQVFVSDTSLVAAGNREAGVASQDRRDRGLSRLSPGINSEIARASNEVAFGYGKLHQDYREFNDGLTPLLPSILDSETGRINSYRLAYIGMFSRAYVQLNLNYSSGDTDYVGFLQAPGPVYTPFNTTTRNSIFDLSERVGYTIRMGSPAALVPYIELGEYYWSREVGRTTIYYGGAEHYSHLSLGVGAKLLFSPVSHLVFELGAGGGYIVLADMVTQGDTFTLGAKAYMSGYTSIDYRFVGNWHLKASADYRKWEYGQSDVVGLYLEPHSQTKQTQYLLSLGYSF